MVDTRNKEGAMQKLIYEVCFNEAIAETVAVVYEKVEKRGI